MGGLELASIQRWIIYGSTGTQNFLEMPGLTFFRHPYAPGCRSCQLFQHQTFILKAESDNLEPISPQPSNDVLDVEVSFATVAEQRLGIGGPSRKALEHARTRFIQETAITRSKRCRRNVKMRAAKVFQVSSQGIKRMDAGRRHLDVDGLFSIGRLYDRWHHCSCCRRTFMLNSVSAQRAVNVFATESSRWAFSEGRDCCPSEPEDEPWYPVSSCSLAASL